MKITYSHNPLSSRLSICIFVCDPKLAQSLVQLLSDERYSLNQVQAPHELLNYVEQHKEQIDCLVLLNDPSLLPLLHQLYEQGTLLPVIFIEHQTRSEHKEDQSRSQESQQAQTESVLAGENANYIYHTGEVRLLSTQLEEIASCIDQAITQFLHLGPNCSISEQLTNYRESKQIQSQQTFLLLQQRRLAEKLKERLGYLGVYYNRNHQYFYRNLSKEEKKELLEQLNREYRQIIINYFSDDGTINQTIDQFVNRAFFADISVSQILEMHMELMDEFAQQLKLEGRSEEILLDYRLALIDIIAHLCEMYRRSIPREDVPLDLLFRID
ncbi:MAG: circadian clock protein KaiA [Prochloraceae cyanobacterium]